MNPDPAAVLSLLPQRDPQPLVDRVLSVEAGTLRAVHAISPAATYFAGHFPGDPVVPGVVQLDALVQAAGLLALATDPTLAGGRLLMMGLDRVRFRRPVRPGEELDLCVTVVTQRGPMWKVDATASVGEEVATSARLLLNITLADAR
jgi:3-hydroxymyristoyl/3-hydroxydecanoyl-(acyl carrier protein) dehydratase